VDIEARMGIAPPGHIHEIDIWVDPLQTARGEEALHKLDVERAHFRPAKKPIAAAERDGPNLPLSVSGIERHGGVGEKAAPAARRSSA